MLAHTLDQHTESLPPASRGVVIAVVIALHLVAAWALMQVSAVREAVLEAAPIFVNLMQPEAPKPVVEPPKPPRVVPRVKHAPPPVITTAPAPEPTPAVFEAPPAPPEPVPEPPPVAAAPVAPVTAPAPAPVRPPEPKTISASEVRYKHQPARVYPAASIRLNEQGEVLLRVMIDAQGHARQIAVQKSSGFARLDNDAMRNVRLSVFHPYQENGQPIPVWVRIPFNYTLED